MHVSLLDETWCTKVLASMRLENSSAWRIEDCNSSILSYLRVVCMLKFRNLSAFPEGRDQPAANEQVQCEVEH